MRWSLVVLAACGVRQHTHDADEIDDLPTEDGGGWAADAPDAPWSFDTIGSALWASDTRGEMGVLLLTAGEGDCDDVVDLYTGLMPVLENDTGLLFVIYRYGGGGFEGTYLGGYGLAPDYSSEQIMQAAAFHDGMYWILSGYYGGGSTWLRIDQIADRVTGEYYASWWAGGYDAVNCGTFVDWYGGYYDTGYYWY